MVYIFQRLRLTGSHPFQEPSDSCCVYNFCHAHTGDVLEQCFQHCFTSMPSRHVEGKHCTVNRAPLFKCCTSLQGLGGCAAGQSQMNYHVHLVATANENLLFPKVQIPIQRLRLTGSHPFQEPSDSCCVYNFCHAHTGDVLEQCFQHCFTSMPSRHVEGKHCTVNRAPLFKCCTSHSSTHSAEFSPKTVKTKSSSFRNDASVTL